MGLIEKLIKASELATAGEWEVIEDRIPFTHDAYGEPEVNGEHVQYRIFTSWVHPQLKDQFPIVNDGIGLGEEKDKPVQFVSIEKEDAQFIAAARNAMPEIIEQDRKYRELVEFNRWLVSEVFREGLDVDAFYLELAEKAGRIGELVGEG